MYVCFNSSVVVFSASDQLTIKWNLHPFINVNWFDWWSHSIIGDIIQKPNGVVFHLKKTSHRSILSISHLSNAFCNGLDLYLTKCLYFYKFYCFSNIKFFYSFLNHLTTKMTYIIFICKYSNYYYHAFLKHWLNDFKFEKLMKKKGWTLLSIYCNKT